MSGQLGGDVEPMDTAHENVRWEAEDFPVPVMEGLGAGPGCGTLGKRLGGMVPSAPENSVNQKRARSAKSEVPEEEAEGVAFGDEPGEMDEDMYQMVGVFRKLTPMTPESLKFTKNRW